MSFESPELAFREAVRRAVRSAFGVEIERVPVSYPPSVAQGDLASTVAFDLARTPKRPPRAIAEGIAAAVVPGGPIARPTFTAILLKWRRMLVTDEAWEIGEVGL